MILWFYENERKKKKLLEEKMEEGSSKTKLKLPHSLSLCFRKVSDVDLSWVSILLFWETLIRNPCSSVPETAKAEHWFLNEA